MAGAETFLREVAVAKITQMTTTAAGTHQNQQRESEMELQIDVELPQEVQPTYHLTIGEITAHYRDVMSVLDAHGISQEQAAAALGLSPTTLTAYGRGYGTAAHRTIPAATLDRLRDIAVDGYWRAAAAPYRAEVAGDDKPLYCVPIWHAVDNWGLLKARHPHPLRALEVADKCGGWVRVGWSADPLTEKLPPIDDRAAIRSRWRKSARRIYQAFGADVEDAAALLCGIADCCRYSLWQYRTEYGPWKLQVSLSQVLKLEAACRDLEGGDEIRPYESDVRRAMADLEDF
ncbi:helix-turn-helix domain-containing protein [Sinorhizobium fredii]|uniref:Helix-turn-helix domain-containing protein n=2 Tax=Rhizobium fredii TaxID=380 RepID=A0A844AJU0_RHIFR|nr:helix-turn-helix transcriptional regulator [Sinorhizobium fredii]MQX11806.1 helix-turn-helix domain-containing protein [Sinorhizobium fredii]